MPLIFLRTVTHAHRRCVHYGAGVAMHPERTVSKRVRVDLGTLQNRLCKAGFSWIMIYSNGCLRFHGRSDWSDWSDWAAYTRPWYCECENHKASRFAISHLYLHRPLSHSEVMCYDTYCSQPFPFRSRLATWAPHLGVVHCWKSRLALCHGVWRMTRP